MSKVTVRMSKNRKKISDITTGNGIIMHMVKNQLQHAHMTKQTKMT